MSTIISWTATYNADGSIKSKGETWNPTTGCSHESDGCRFCYAESLSLRFGWSKLPWTAVNAPANVTLHPDRLRKPYSWKQPVRVFVNSMSDLFHPQVPDSFIARVFAVMNDTPQHTYQVLTKRPKRAAAWAGPWSENIWMGTSVEDSRVAHRIDSLRDCKAQTLFLSCEPLIGPLGDVDLSGIHWMIVGGESGMHMNAHPNRWMDHAWARDLRDQCAAQSVAYFFKQSSAIRTEVGTALEYEDGSLWLHHQYPGDMAAPVQVFGKSYAHPRPPAQLPVLTGVERTSLAA